MSFLKIANPIKREQIVKEFLAIKKNIRANELAEKTGKIKLREDLSEFFKPVTETQKETQKETREAITKGLEPIRMGIEELPQKLPQEKRLILKCCTILGRPYSPPPAYSSLEPSTSKAEPQEKIGEIFSGSDTKFGVYEKGGEFFIGDKIVEDIEGTDGNEYINIGDAPFKKSYLITPGLKELLERKNPNIDDIPATDISMYVKILDQTNSMYAGNDPENDELKSVNDPELQEKFEFIIKPAWFRKRGKKKRAGKKEKTGKGIKKVVIPSDPNALLEKLDLLMTSKAAGNTGVRNDFVSVCDELKRQGFFDSNIYKKNNVLIIKI